MRAAKTRKARNGFFSKRTETIVYTVVATLAITSSFIWFARDSFFGDVSLLVDKGEKLVTAKALLRLQADLLDESLRDIHGLRDTLLRQNVELRALAARDQLSTEHDRAVFDEFVVSMQKDVESLSEDESMRSLSQREKLREGADRLQSDLKRVFGKAFFEGDIEIVKQQIELPIEDEPPAPSVTDANVKGGAGDGDKAVDEDDYKTVQPTKPVTPAHAKAGHTSKSVKSKTKKPKKAAKSNDDDDDDT